MPKKVPVDEVIRMARKSISDSQMIKVLRDEGYSPKEIHDAFNQAKIKLELAKTAGIEVEVPEEEEARAPAAEEAEAPQEEAPAEEYAPSPQYAQAAPEYAQPQQEYAPQPEYAQPAYAPQEYAPQYAAEAPSSEAMEEIAEGIISEKWDEFKAKVGDVGEMKAHFESRLNELNDRIKRLELTFDRLNATMLGRMEEYTRSVKSLGSEVETLESTLGKVMPPLVSAAKEKARAKPVKK